MDHIVIHIMVKPALLTMVLNATVLLDIYVPRRMG
jgi:hypothetical protein